MDYSFLSMAGIVVIGAAAGFFNTIGGGGTLLVLPFLTFMGMDIAVANGTNRLGVLLQSGTAAVEYGRKKVLSLKTALPLALFSTIGSVAGTFLAINIDRKYLNLSVAAAISFMAVLLVFRPAMWETVRETKVPRYTVFAVFFAIGVYGGFIQAGVGFFLSWALAVAVGVDLVRGNAIKMVIVGTYNIISLAIFYKSGLVDIPVGLALAGGSVVGAVFGAKFAVARGSRWIRWILAGTIIISASKMVMDVF